MSLYSLQIEKHCLSGLLKNPDIFSDVDAFITENDFYNKTHCTIFCVLRSLIISNEKFDHVVLAQKISNLGIKFYEEVDIFHYIDDLNFIQISRDTAIKSFRELNKLKIKREICETAEKIKKYVSSNLNSETDAVIAECDKIYGEKISNYGLEQEPDDLFQNLRGFIEEKSKHPEKEAGLITQYKEFNEHFGGIRSGNGVYAIVSRPKQGKSLWLLNMAMGTVSLNPNCKALYLDTEMKQDVNKLRAASALTQVPMWFFETGNWKMNPEYTTRFNKNIDSGNIYKNKIFHLTVSNRPIEQICSTIRRWYYKYVGKGNQAIIIYDYIKLTGEKLFNNWAEHQAIGQKINLLNEIGSSLNIPIWTSCQLNRSAESGTDDSSAIAVSDRLQWFASFVAIFRQKTLEEIEEDTTEFGTHKLIPLATRFQGKKSYGHNDLIKIPNGKGKSKYKKNFINYDVTNFLVTEKGTLRDIVEAQKYKPDLSHTATAVNNELL